MTRWIHNPEGRIIAFVRDLPEKMPIKDNSLKANGGLVLASALLVALGLFVIWPSDEPETLPITAEYTLASQLLAGATGEIDGERYLATLTTVGEENQQPALELFSVSESGELAPAGTLSAPLDALDSDLPAAPGIAFDGTTVYVPLAQSRESALWIVDVANPEAPREIATVPLETPPGSVAVDGALMAVGPLDGVLTRFFDVTNPDAPEAVGSYSHSTVSTTNVKLAGRTLYFGDHYGISVVDLTSLDDPHEIGRYEDDDWVSGFRSSPGRVTPHIAVEQDHLYAAADTFGVNVVDVSNATDPDATTRKLERNPSTRQQDVAVDAATADTHLVILRRRGLDYVVRDIDITNPGDPDVVAETDAIAAPEADYRSLALDSVFAYFLDGSTIHVIALTS